MPLPTVASLWIGGDLTYLEQLCMKSFVDHGHRTLLYTYEGVSNAPEGVEVLDANTLFPATSFIRHKRTGSPANHADAFRYRMLTQQDVVWVDTDMLCMRPWDIDTDFIFGWEKPGNVVCNAVLGLPLTSKTLQAMNDFCADDYPIPPWAQKSEQNDLRRLADAGDPVHVTDLKWGVWGPKAITHFLNETGEIEHAMPQKAFYPISFKDRTWLLRPNFPIDEHLGDGCYGVHLWNRRVRRRLITHHGGLPKSASFLGRMLKEHGIDPEAAPIPDVPPVGNTTKDEVKTRIEALEKRQGQGSDETPSQDSSQAVTQVQAQDQTQSMMPQRSYRPWGMENPRVLIATCMKDEGPFILEWVAWHQALGVTDFVVYSNDCTDGTDEILSRLSALGHITHLENPAVAQGSTYFQPAALNHLHSMDVTARVDFIISIDVDEFINVHSGTGHLSDLFKSSGPFDALSMSELNHGSNGQKEFKPGWITEQFPAHQNPRPGKWKAARGVKTITRPGPKLDKIRNHRPDFLPDLPLGAGPVVWLDGSGRQTDVFLQDHTANGTDCRGGYGLVTLEHYPLRSLQSYLAKKHRGDVVIKGKSVGQRYWRVRNQNDSRSDTPRIAGAARDRYADLMRDPTLKKLHETACERHVQTIKTLSTDPEFVAFKDWILAEAWNSPEQDPVS